jgi:hypothetical protein
LNDWVTSRSRQGGRGVTQREENHNHESKCHAAIYDNTPDHTQWNLFSGILDLITYDFVSFPGESWRLYLYDALVD